MGAISGLGAERRNCGVCRRALPHQHLCNTQTAQATNNCVTITCITCDRYSHGLTHFPSPSASPTPSLCLSLPLPYSTNSEPMGICDKKVRKEKKRRTPRTENPPCMRKEKKNRGKIKVCIEWKHRKMIKDRIVVNKALRRRANEKGGGKTGKIRSCDSVTGPVISREEERGKLHFILYRVWYLMMTALVNSQHVTQKGNGGMKMIKQTPDFWDNKDPPSNTQKQRKIRNGKK